MRTASFGSYGEIRFVLLAVLILNWIVAGAKIFYGYLSGSGSILADGFHSLSDGASNIIGIVGISLAAQPVDANHPYGHKKFETLFSLAIGAMLLFVAFGIGKEGVARIIHPAAPHITVASFAIMIVTLIVNILVMRYEHRRGVALKSDILVADSMHTRADILVSLSVIIALVFVKLGFPGVDPVATVAIAVFIAYSAFRIIKDCSKVLCDEVAIVDVKVIEGVVRGIAGVENCHKIRTRGRADYICIDLHVQVRPEMPISRAHRISYEVEEALKKSVDGVTDVVVHIEPSED